MKAIYTTRIIIILNLIFIISCNGEKSESDNTNNSPRIRKHSRLDQPKINQTFVLGESVPFEVHSSTPIDSIILDYNGEETVYLDSSFQWIAKRAKTGTQKLRLTVYTVGDVESHYPRIRFLSDVKPEAYTYEIVEEYDHDVNAYTQGLFFIGDTLVESTGREGLSKLCKINLNTGEVYQSVSLPNEYFGEGSTIWENQIIQLTWTSQTGFVYNRQLKKQKQFNYTHEGWGITTYGDTLIVSDGTEVLHLLDPRDFSELGKLEVYTDEKKVVSLNELEMINGLLYANVWLEDLIVVIDPASGKVLKRINMRSLKRKVNNGAEAFNGIAYKPQTDQVFVTGKLWSKIFEVKFIPELSN